MGSWDMKESGVEVGLKWAKGTAQCTLAVTVIGDIAARSPSCDGVTCTVRMSQSVDVRPDAVIAVLSDDVH